MATRNRLFTSLRFRQTLVCCVQAALVCLAVAGPASAADYTWTTNTTAGQALTDGAGNFTAGGFNWALNGDINSRVVWPASTSDTAVFGAGSGTAGQVVTTAPMTANGLKFAQTGSGSYTILLGSNVNSITLGGTTPTITVNSGVSATITANSTGGDGRLLGNDVTITGGGTLTFSLMSTTANSTTGGLAALGRGSSNNTNTSITQDGNTTVNFSGSGGWTLANDSSGNNVGGSGKATYTLKSGTLAGSSGTANDNFLQIGRNWAAEFKQEGGTVSLNATLANTLTIGGRGNGTYTLSGGTFSATAGGLLMSGNAPSSGSAPVSALSISGGTMRFGLAGVMASASGSSSSVTLSGGELAINTLTKGTSGTVTSFAFSGGTLRPYNSAATFGSTNAGNNFTITLSGTGATFSGTDNATSAARTTTVEALLSGTGRVNVNGGTVQFGNSGNNYSGATVIAGGSLKLDADASIASSTSVVVGSTGSSGATLDLTAKAAAFAFGSGQTVGGIGSVLMPTNGVSLAGFLAPGDGGIGTLTFTNARTLDLEPAIDAGSNRFLFDLGAGDVSDLVSLSTGTLNIGSGKLQFSDFAFSLSPLSQGTYRLFSASTISGTLTSDTAARKGTITGAYTGELVQGAGYIDLVVVPEPGAVALVGIGLGFGVVCLRRSRQK
jgi:fibronectin-binding autotransporter adhesin